MGINNLVLGDTKKNEKISKEKLKFLLGFLEPTKPGCSDAVYNIETV